MAVTSAAKGLVQRLAMADTMKARGMALTELCEFISEETNQARLTIDTFDALMPGAPKCDMVTWVDVIKAGVRAMRTKVNATFTLAKLTMWTDFKRLLSTAESRGKFLCTSRLVNVVISTLLEHFESYVENPNQTRLLGPIVDALRIVMSPIEYQSEISEHLYSEIFRLFSRTLMALCSRSSSTREKDSCPLSDGQSAFGKSNPKACAQIVDIVLKRYPYDVLPFLEDDVFPFYVSFFVSTPKDCNPSGDVILSLASVLRSHILSVTGPFCRFFGAVLPCVTSLLATSLSPAFRDGLLQFVDVSLDGLQAIGHSSVLVDISAPNRDTWVALRETILKIIAQMDVMPNSVYHESGLTLSLSLSESWNTLLRVAASLIYHLCPGFDPDIIESVSSSPAASPGDNSVERAPKRHRSSVAGTGCPWATVFDSSTLQLPTSSLWLLHSLVTRFGRFLSKALVERITAILLNDASTVAKQELVTSELRVSWLLCTLCRYLTISEDSATDGCLQLLADSTSFFRTRKASLFAQLSATIYHLWLKANTETRENVRDKLIEKLRLSASSDSFTIAAVSEIIKYHDRREISVRKSYIETIVESLVTGNEPADSQLQASMVIAEHSEFQANVAVSAIEHLIIDATTSRPPQSILLGAIPLKALTYPISLGFPEIDPKCGFLDWYREQFEFSLVDAPPFSEPSSARDLLYEKSMHGHVRQVLASSIASELQRPTADPLHAVRLLRACIAFAVELVGDCVKLMANMKASAPVPSQWIASLLHLKSIVSFISPNDVRTLREMVILPWISFLSEALVASRCSMRIAPCAMRHPGDPKSCTLALFACCDILYSHPNASDEQLSKLDTAAARLLHCQEFRASFAIARCNSEIAARFLQAVTSTDPPYPQHNIISLAMSAAIVPEVLLSSTYELAFDHYEHLLKRLRPTNVNEEAIDEGELPRIIRVLIVHSSFDMFRFRRNRKLGTIDPENVLLDACSDIDASVRRHAGIRVIQCIRDKIKHGDDTLQACLICIKRLSDAYDDACGDSSPDEGRILTVLETIANLAQKCEDSRPEALTVLCRALTASDQCSRSVARRLLQDLSSSSKYSLADMIMHDFEEIWSAWVRSYSGGNDYMDLLQYCQKFPFYVIVPGTPVCETFDLRKLPGHLLSLVLSGIFFEKRHTALPSLVMSHVIGKFGGDQSSLSGMKACFLSRAIVHMVSRNENQPWLPISLFTSKGLNASSVDPLPVVVCLAEALTKREPVGIAPAHAVRALQVLADQLKFKSVESLLLGSSKSGRTLYSFLVYSRKLLHIFHGRYMSKFTRLVTALASVAMGAVGNCLLQPAVLRQLLSTLLWIATELDAPQHVMPAVDVVVEFVIRRRPELLSSSIRSQLSAAYELTYTNVPSPLGVASFQAPMQQIEFFLDGYQRESALLSLRITDRIRLPKLLEALRTMTSECALQLDDDVWIRVIGCLIDRTANGDKVGVDLALSCLGMLGLLLGPERVQRVSDSMQSDNAFILADQASRRRWMLSLLCSYLVHSEPAIISNAVDCLQIICGGDSTSDQEENLAPFLSQVVFAPPRITISDRDLCASLSNAPDDGSFSAWACQTTSVMSLSSLDDTMRACSRLIALDANLATLVFPHLILDIIMSSDKPEHRNLHARRSSTVASPQGALAVALCSLATKGSARALSLVVETLRVIRHHKVLTLGLLSNATSNNRGSSRMRKAVMLPSTTHEHPILRFEGHLRFLSLAEACLRRGRPSTALYFLTVWAESQAIDDQNGSASLLTGEGNAIAPKDLELYRRLLIRVSSDTSDGDILHGACVSDFSSSTEALLQQQEGNWLRVLQAYDGDSVYGASASGEHATAIGKTLASMRCLGVLQRFCEEGSDQQYEAAWKCSDWSLDIAYMPDGPGVGFHQHLYTALRSVSQGAVPPATSSELVRSARLDIPVPAVHIDERSAAVADVLDKLAALSAIDAHLFGISTADADPSALVRDVHSVLLFAQCPAGAPDFIRFSLRHCRRALDLQDEGLANFELLQCKRAGNMLHSTTAQASSLRLEMNMERCRLMWLQGSHSRAIHAMSSLIDAIAGGQNDDVRVLLSRGHLCIARWASSARTHSHDFIMSRYGMACGSGVRDPSAFFEFAQFQDRVLAQLLEKETSNEARTAEKLHEERRQDLVQLRAQLARHRKSVSKDGPMDDIERRLRGFIKTLELQHAADEDAITRRNTRIEQLAVGAVENFIRCMELGDDHDLSSLYGLVHIWFELYARVPSVTRLVDKAVNEVQSRKFLPLLPQIASRLQTFESTADPADKFHSTVQQLVLRVVYQHPHVSVYVLFALCNLDRIAGAQVHRLHEAYSMNTDKKAAAERSLALVAAQSSEVASLIRAQKALAEAYIDLSTVQSSSKSTSKIDLKAHALTKLLKPGYLSVRICPPTRPPPVSRSADYASSVSSAYGLVSFNRVATYAQTGLSRPIILGFTCEDGTTHQELVKPNDDLRQDAVMEQVFQLVNNLLRADRAANQRDLQMRTYNVVPLTPCVGLVQFISGTISLGEYLYDAHERYRPGDYPVDMCRARIRDSPPGSIDRDFEMVLKNCKPVFHHFLHEHWPSCSASWLNAQLRYTRSVAVGSMVGYIVGLGDRHCQNILIDVNDFTLVHIDLGIAFDQGKLLKKPELVPFRLTRDIVDAMGVTGVEGVFRRACEQVLTILRANQKSILTLISVFKFDPLYRWSISAQKIKTIQQGSDSISELVQCGVERGRSSAGPSTMTANTSAVRACLGVKHKLEGREDGDVLSVPGQVHKLIVDATSHYNLARMFHGWSAWL
ncbi:unnamed protein product (mitochondrion) [Plasmodiophora brassicae]|uniref:non-specific serine/threonine protein kinase n=1 Tax=Plasmodiophora brassicae TaxID=37360 RepID=A0A0G4IH40_PLABS|nr:hypothetical protein PBRA_000316 [Plasmodiophora brassicae]SPQ96877.1 unnamed protein product [Plasmodiophora brassicae]